MKGNAYLLAYAMKALIHGSDKQIRYRLNLLAFIAGLVHSSIDSKSEIKEIWDEIKKLRQSYEYVIEYSDYAFEKRCAFEMALDNVLLELNKLINKYELLDSSVLEKVYVGDWDKRR